MRRGWINGHRHLSSQRTRPSERKDVFSSRPISLRSPVRQVPASPLRGKGDRRMQGGSALDPFQTLSHFPSKGPRAMARGKEQKREKIESRCPANKYGEASEGPPPIVTLLFSPPLFLSYTATLVSVLRLIYCFLLFLPACLPTHPFATAPVIRSNLHTYI